MLYRNIRNKTFILGVGAQKAGTSWLFRYFSGFNEIACPAVKELHVFDAWYRPDLCRRFDVEFLGRLRDALAGQLQDGNVQDLGAEMKCLISRARMIFDRSAYLDYFESIMREDCTHMCEITPSYSLIGAEGWSEIRDLFNSADVSLKIIFILRDPIDRYYSALRMRELNTNGHQSAKGSFLKEIRSQPLLERGRYDLTIRNLVSVFSNEDLYFGFYENLFSDGSMKKMTEFLGLQYAVPDFGTRINDSSRLPAVELSEDELNAAREIFAPVYDFCNRYFGNKLPAAWRM